MCKQALHSLIRPITNELEADLHWNRENGSYCLKMWSSVAFKCILLSSNYYLYDTFSATEDTSSMGGSDNGANKELQCKENERNFCLIPMARVHWSISSPAVSPHAGIRMSMSMQNTLTLVKWTAYWQGATILKAHWPIGLYSSQLKHFHGESHARWH